MEPNHSWEGNSFPADQEWKPMFHDVTKTASHMSLHNLKCHPLTFISYYPRIYA